MTKNLQSFVFSGYYSLRTRSPADGFKGHFLMRLLFKNALLATGHRETKQILYPNKAG